MVRRNRKDEYERIARKKDMVKEGVGMIDDIWGYHSGLSKTMTS